ncbi:MAG: endonuclease/exonuclease/phosphatase family protein [Tannerella sp.]|nr:endonuclease/exonuclease/phosphatase family protein [Tannerella sp.]
MENIAKAAACPTHVISTIRKISTILTVTVWLLSCKSGTNPVPEPMPEPEDVTLEVSASEYQFEADRQLAFTVSVKSNRPVTATSSQEWCTAEIVGGKTADNLKISVSENIRIDRRTATVTVTAEDSEKPATFTIKISQQGVRPILSIEEGAVYVTGERQEFTVRVAANFSPVAFVLPPWISLKSPDNPENGGIYTFVADGLPAAVELRKDSLTVKAANPDVTAAVSIPVVQTDVTSLNVMSYNIYLASGSLLNWSNRRDALLKFIRLADVDILGTQETEYTQHDFLKRNLTEYAAYGVGRNDGKTDGEHNTIFYKKGRFTEHGHGTFWLNQTPDAPGKGWDAGYPRIASWVILEDKLSGKRIFAVNTHIDHIGSEAQKNSIPLLMERISALHGDLPVVLTGDFNMPPSNGNIRYVTDASAGHYSLLHAKAIAETPAEGNVGTYHALTDADPGIGALIDFIFVDENIRVLRYAVSPPRFESQFLSDHSAVTAKIEIR